MSLVATTYIGVLAHRGEERGEVQVPMVGLLKNYFFDTAAVRSGYKAV